MHEQYSQCCDWGAEGVCTVREDKAAPRELTLLRHAARNYQVSGRRQWGPSGTTERGK
jgi:hypothetical protein